MFAADLNQLHLEGSPLLVHLGLDDNCSHFGGVSSPPYQPATTACAGMRTGGKVMASILHGPPGWDGGDNPSCGRRESATIVSLECAHDSCCHHRYSGSTTPCELDLNRRRVEALQESQKRAGATICLDFPIGERNGAR